jgi:uncharacterized protein DUF5615
MLQFLLDENLSPVVAEQVRRGNPKIMITSLREWRRGEFIGAEDSAILTHAALEGLTLVTYDRRSIIPLLKAWAEQRVDHQGVVFVDSKSLRSHDFGGLVKAIVALWNSDRAMDWKNQVIFLRRTK